MSDETLADNSTPTEENQTTADAEESASQPEPEFEDQELADAKAEMAKEEAGEPADKDKDEKPKSETEDEPAEKPSQEDDDEGKKAAEEDGREPDQVSATEQPMIPKSRFDEAVGQERARTEEAMRAASYWKGVSDASGQKGSAPGQPEGPDQPEQKTPETVIAEERAKLAELATKYDDGDISTADFEKERAEIDDRIWEARRSQITPEPKEEPAKVDPGEGLYLDQLTAELEGKHPFTREIPDNDPRWNTLQQEALRALESEGVLLPPGDRGKFVLRQRMAELTDHYGPLWTGKTLEELKGETSDKEETPSEDETPALSPTAKARADKLALADNHPPDTSKVGSTGDSTEVSDAAIEAMSDDQIAALPENVRRRILPTTE